MNKTYLFTFAFYLFVVATQAQDLPEPTSPISTEKQAVSMTDEMDEQIRLDEEQRSAVQQTWKEYFAGMETLEEAESKKSAHRKALMKLEQSRNFKMKGILDEDQYTQYEDFLKNNLASSKDKSKESS